MTSVIDTVRTSAGASDALDSMCHWSRSACALGPEWYIVWSIDGVGEVELFCQRHYILTLDWWVSVERMSRVSSLHYVDRGRL